jgi:U4/U6.U5 tri-snRNP-associated protein 2
MWLFYIYRDNFKSVISPQDFIQVLTTESKRRFSIGVQAEAIDLFVWLCNEITKAIIQSNARVAAVKLASQPQTIIQQCFQGTVEVRTWTRPNPKTSELANDGQNGSKKKTGASQKQSRTRVVTDPLTNEIWEETVTETPFNYLSLDIPPTPLFRDSQVEVVVCGL